MNDLRDIFWGAVLEKFRQDDKLILLNNDQGFGLFEQLQKEFPQRVYNLGLGEQALVGMAAGLAKQGMKPLIHSISPFLIYRAFEQTQ